MQVRCPERDKIILALALAANNVNNGYAMLEWATEEADLAEALRMIEDSRDQCIRLRALIVRHCQSHGC